MECIGFVEIDAHSYKNKTTPDLSIVKRLGGSGFAKVHPFSELTKYLAENNAK